MLLVGFRLVTREQSQKSACQAMAATGPECVISGFDVYYEDHIDNPRLCKLLRERERAWMLAAKLVVWQQELVVLLDRGFYMSELAA